MHSDDKLSGLTAAERMRVAAYLDRAIADVSVSAERAAEQIKSLGEQMVVQAGADVSRAVLHMRDGKGEVVTISAPGGNVDPDELAAVLSGYNAPIEISVPPRKEVRVVRKEHPTHSDKGGRPLPKLGKTYKGHSRPEISPKAAAAAEKRARKAKRAFYEQQMRESGQHWAHDALRHAGKP
jgi:hypothetical protein